MKKIIQICMLFILLLGNTSLAMAEETDLFYYSYNIEELNEYIENKSAEVFEQGDIIFLTLDRDGVNGIASNKYIAKGEEIDPSKITHGYNEIWCDYNWTPGRITGFLTSQNKADYLKNLDIKQYHVPMYYNGERTTIEDKIEKFDQGYGSRTGDTYSPDYQEFIQKDKLVLRMEKDGISGYTPIQFIQYWDFGFVVAEKDDVCYLIYMPIEELDYSENYANIRGYEEFDAKFGSYMKNQVMTVEQAEQMLPALEDAVNKSIEIGNSMPSEEGAGNTSSTNPNTKTLGISAIADDEETPDVSVWLWLIPLCAVVLLTDTAVTICIIHKKKKA